MAGRRYSLFRLLHAQQLLPAAAAALFLAACGGKSGTSATKREVTADERKAAQETSEITAGTDTRIVWLSAAGDDTRTICGMDAKDGAGVREISPGAAGWRKPLIASDGASVVVSRLTIPPQDGEPPVSEIFLIPWAGGTPSPLGPGFAVAVHRDSAEGVDWIYALETLRPARRSALTGSMLVRFRAATPDEREIIWADGLMSTDNFQLSRDGKRAAGLFPWPRAGLLDLSDPARRRWQPLGHGSWIGLAADDSYASCLLDGSRGRLRCTAPNLEPGWDFKFAEMQANFTSQTVGSVRWANDPRLLAMTVGEDVGAEIWLAHFSDDLRRFLRFVRITYNSAADSEPDVWVHDGHLRTTVLPQQPVTPEPKELPWPAAADSLLFSWENSDKPNAIERGGQKTTCTVTPQTNACQGRFGSMNVSAGWFAADDASGNAIADSCRQSGEFSLGLVLTERPVTGSQQPVASVRLVSLQRRDGTDLFALHRVDKWIVLRLLIGTDEAASQEYTFDISRLAIEDQRPVELNLSMRGDSMGVYLDGSRVHEFRLPGRGLAAWRDARLFFGDPMPYGDLWRGTIERVAIHSRGLDEAEVKEGRESTLLVLEKRRKAEVISAEMKLIESSSFFPLEKLTGIRSGLTTSVWEVTRLGFGPNLIGKRVAVLHWAVMDGKPLPAPVMSAPGNIADLVLESLNDHDELSREYIHDTTGSVNLPVYFDPSLPRPSFAAYR